MTVGNVRIPRREKLISDIKCFCEMFTKVLRQKKHMLVKKFILDGPPMIEMTDK